MLVVEDDVLVRNIVADYLRDVGFRVIEAVNASEATVLLAAHNDIDIVFSDISMPGEMDGFGLATWIDQHGGGVPVLLTSGAHAGRCNAEGRQFILKPYDYAEMERRLRHLLGDNFKAARGTPSA